MTTHEPLAASAEASPRAGARRSGKPYLWASIIFLCGVVTGVALGIIGIHAFMEYRFKHPEVAYMRLADSAGGDLNLTPDQRKKVDEILHKKAAEFRVFLTTELRARSDAHFDSLREEVAAVLDERQAAQWRRNFDEVRARSLPPFPPPIHDEEGGVAP